MSSTYPVIKGALLSSENYTWNTADSVGRGASAVVFLGRHKTKGTVVAVKVFHDHIGYREDDLRELELLKRLNHRNIIRLLAIEKELTSQKKVLVTEYCEGGSLHQMLDQPLYYYGLPEQEYKLVLFHVADGMKYLREKNVIHRDIKPGNIMRSLTQEGFSVYKLTDFGAARNLDEDESFHSLYGTEEYLYPGVYERAVLKQPTRQSFDAKVDLWSLGVTFYHTATGELPFQPFGGRQNRSTMFEIITRKENGVISGVQTFQNGPIQWRRDLPDTSPLSSGLRSLVVPLLAKLMEPDQQSMIQFEPFFRTVEDIRQMMTVEVFHFDQCKKLTVYAHPSTTLSGLQDLIASLTEIPAEDQILLVGGRGLEEVVDPVAPLGGYPAHLLHDSLYLFQREMSEAARLPKLEIPAFPDFNTYSDMDSDARLAHSCAARGELIKRYQKGICEQQESLMNGLLYFRLYVENRLLATKLSHESMQQLMTECDLHVKTFFFMTAMLKDAIAAFHRPQNLVDIRTLEEVLKDTLIRQVYSKAAERMGEIEQYREVLVRRLEEVKNLAGKVTAGCREEQCHEKVVHHMSVITAVQSRFRRDKSVKQQMSKHDENIHQFERQKLQMHCATMKSIFTDHCMGQLDKVYRSSLQVCESLTRCLTRVMKVEKNINSVLSCQKLLSQKLSQLGEKLNSLRSVDDSGFGSTKMDYQAPKPAAAAAAVSAGGSDKYPTKSASSMPSNFSDSVLYMSSHTQELGNKLSDLQRSLNYNMDLIKSLEGPPLESSGSLARSIQASSTAIAECVLDDCQNKVRLPSSATFDLMGGQFLHSPQAVPSDLALLEPAGQLAQSRESPFSSPATREVITMKPSASVSATHGGRPYLPSTSGVARPLVGIQQLSRNVEGEETSFPITASAAYDSRQQLFRNVEGEEGSFPVTTSAAYDSSVVHFPSNDTNTPYQTARSVCEKSNLIAGGDQDKGGLVASFQTAMPVNQAMYEPIVKSSAMFKTILPRDVGSDVNLPGDPSLARRAATEDEDSTDAFVFPPREIKCTNTPAGARLKDSKQVESAYAKSRDDT